MFSGNLLYNQPTTYMLGVVLENRTAPPLAFDEKPTTRKFVFPDVKLSTDWTVRYPFDIGRLVDSTKEFHVVRRPWDLRLFGLADNVFIREAPDAWPLVDQDEPSIFLSSVDCFNEI